ncbi:hypothetical protein [Cecembia lonarensis]|uniref:Uncharacterized protein n=1 Tax=Cecembia lonarensis (strain CCUG 58316 / KCTC 22772 / LW9) TaxID=1225176 RepID=K1L740_CECL9|nr:hypothetical protein [Cecembia lonarensis]EKB50576.1 hypothetical protein B879_00779 [Cecembia lonarensis LW9]
MKNSFLKNSILKTVAFPVIVLLGINFGIQANDEGLEDGTSTCADSCESDDFKVCSIAATDANGHPITVLCHFMKKK